VIGSVLRRTARSWLLLLLLAGVFAAGWAGSTLAYFDGEVDQTATYAGGYVGSPSNQTATASGYDGAVTWSLTDTTGVQGQQVLMADNGTSTDCSSVAYTTTVATGFAPSATSYTDSNRTATSGAGDQYCYAAESYYTKTSWYQVARAPATQLGLVVDSVVLANGGLSGHLDGGDTITLTFNQPPATPASATICQFHTGGIVFIGDSTCSVVTDNYAIGELSGFTVGGVGHQKRSASVSISGNVMTVTIGQSGQTFSGSGSFTPSPNLVSAATTDQATVCQTGSSCLPTPSGSF